MNGVVRKRSARTLATRAGIIAAAERLYADRGVTGVSLNEITRASGQKNRNAINYHFGSQQGLLEAIFAKHCEALARQREAMHATLPRRGKSNLHHIISALVQPVAGRLEDRDGGVSFLRICAQLTTSELLKLSRIGAEPGRDIPWDPTVEDLLIPHLTHLPAPLRRHRLSLVVSLVFNALADHATGLEERGAEMPGRPAFLSDLVDSCCAILVTPPSPATIEALPP